MKNIFDGLSRLAMTHEESLSLMRCNRKKGEKPSKLEVHVL